MPNKFFIVFISSLLSFTFVNAQGAIPPDFKCPDCILLIIKPESNKTVPGFEKHVEKQFKKYYSGKFEIVTAKELDTESRFQDKKIHKFTLNQKLRYESRMIPGADNRMREVTKTYIRFHVYDRETGTEYPSFAEGRTGNESVERTAKMLEGTYK
jgi:hypothetical protein